MIDSTIVTQLFRRQRKGPLDELTERETAVLHQMAEGRSNVGIGQALSLSPRTVEAHVKMIFAKLGLFGGDADNRRVLAVLAWLRRSPTH